MRIRNERPEKLENTVQALKEKLIQKGKVYLPLLIGGGCFAFLLYFTLISNQLVNANDGLWQYGKYQAGKWDISLGRWLWPYLDKLRFGGLSPEPLTSLTALFLFVLGTVLILDIFQMGRRGMGCLAGMLFLSSTCICISLSYRFQSPAFGFAFFFSALAAWIVVNVRSVKPAIVLSAFSLAASAGLYQSYVCCTCVILAGYFIWLLFREDVEEREIIRKLSVSAGCGVFGAILYVLGLEINLKIFGVVLSDYQGANSYSLVNSLRNIGISIRNCYLNFGNYFFDAHYYHINAVARTNRVLYYMIFFMALLFLAAGLSAVYKRSRKRAALYAALVLALPVAAYVVALIATSAGLSLQTTGGLALVIPVLACVESKIAGRGGWRSFAKLCNTVLLLVLLYGNIYQVQIDQTALLEGETSTITISQDIIHRLSDMGYLSDEEEYCILGVPLYNDIFSLSEYQDYANNYALFGSWYLDYANSRKSWQSVFRNLCGLNLTMCSAEVCESVLYLEEVQSMPVWPQEGCIIKVNDVIVIRVSEEY